MILELSIFLRHNKKFSSLNPYPYNIVTLNSGQPHMSLPVDYIYSFVRNIEHSLCMSVCILANQWAGIKGIKLLQMNQSWPCM